MTRAKEILDKLLRGDNVSRWHVSLHSKSIRWYVAEKTKYKHLSPIVEDLIESANESL